MLPILSQCTHAALSMTGAQGGETLASAMLGGALRSDVRAKGARTSATFQPFTHLQLDIYPYNVTSVADAFQFLTTAEHLEGELPAWLPAWGCRTGPALCQRVGRLLAVLVGVTRHL